MPLRALNDTALWVEEIGAGEPALLVVHGGPGFDHTYFRPWLDPLAADYRLVYVDLREHGRSRRRVGNEFRTSMVVADLEALRVSLGLGRVALLGHSFGGFMALSYVVAHRDGLRALVLVATAADIWALGGTGDRLRAAGGDALVEAWRTVTLDDGDFWTARRKILPYMFAVPSPSQAAAVFAQVRPAAEPNAFWFRREAARYDVRAELPGLRVPTLVIAGRADRFAPLAAGEALARGLPAARLRVFEHSGHLPFVEEQPDFLAAVREHLRESQ
jgi:proline iminopeptidase